MKAAIIGAGNMGGAIARGLAKGTIIPAGNIIVSNPTQGKLDKLKADVEEVKLWNPAEDGVYPAIREEAYIEVTSYGGDTTGYQIPFTLHYTGEKVKGNFNLATRTFTAA